MGKRYGAAKIMNVAVVGSFNAPVSRKANIITIDAHNSIRDERAYKKGEIILPKKVLEEIYNVYTHGYYNWDKMNRMEKIDASVVGLTLFGIGVAADYLSKGTISDNVKKGGKFIKEKAGKASGAAFFGGIGGFVRGKPAAGHQ